jgi:hypothetical protein
MHQFWDPALNRFNAYVNHARSLMTPISKALHFASGRLYSRASRAIGL